LQTTIGGVLGLSLTEMLALRDVSAAATGGVRAIPKGRAKSCIVLFCWGGVSHLDTWDMKPNAGSNVRSIFRPIATSTPGIHLSEHMPEIAKRMDKLAVVRSVHHKAADHRQAAYWNLTGHQPRTLGAPPSPPTREDWPCLGSMVSYAMTEQKRSVTTPESGLRSSVSIPYPIADGGLLNGQYAGMLGHDWNPLLVKPKGGKPYEGVSPPSDELNLDPIPGVDPARLRTRQNLLKRLEVGHQSGSNLEKYRRQAFDMVASSKTREAFDVSRESAKTRAAYGDHICGQSVLLARRLTDAGVPMATVYCSAGDLNGSKGSHWDTHADGFNRLKRDMLPPLDQASGALIDDLESTGRLDETLVVWLTEFGRTPAVNGSGGRDHYPNCYSVAFAGAGIAGGQVYGASDKIGSEPARQACGPEHLHATILRSLGIDSKMTFNDLQGRPRFLCDAEALPLG